MQMKQNRRLGEKSLLPVVAGNDLTTATTYVMKRSMRSDVTGLHDYTQAIESRTDQRYCLCGPHTDRETQYSCCARVCVCVLNVQAGTKKWHPWLILFDNFAKSTPILTTILSLLQQEIRGARKRISCCNSERIIVKIGVLLPKLSNKILSQGCHFLDHSVCRPCSCIVEQIELVASDTHLSLME